MRHWIGLVSFGVALLMSGCVSRSKNESPASASSPVLKNEFIYETASFPSCHASTIEDTASGLVAAWFGGSDEGNSDVGIWVSRHDGQRWSAPVEVANGVSEDGRKRYPTWNPVLFQTRGSELLLFYKVGPTPSKWWGMMSASADGGKTWFKSRRLPEGILGPVKNKPIQLEDGTLLCPSSSEHDGWRVHMETISGRNDWQKSAPLNDGREFGAIQPTILRHSEERLQILCRSRQNVITECWSEDGGKTWSPMKATELPNPNSGVDAVTLKDGRHLMVHNPVTRGRSPLVVSLSSDGKKWEQVAVLENQSGEYSYPAIIQSRDGLAHITYTWKRQRIKHAVLDPRTLSAAGKP